MKFYLILEQGMKSGKTRRLGQAVLGQLVAFEATARLNSFRAAADELHLTTGAVAQQIRLMEQKLGMQLFERLPRGTRLLTEAEGFLNKVQLALDLVDDATQIAPTTNGGAKGETRANAITARNAPLCPRAPPPGT